MSGITDDIDDDDFEPVEEEKEEGKNPASRPSDPLARRRVEDKLEELRLKKLNDDFGSDLDLDYV